MMMGKGKKKKILFITNTGRFYHFEQNNVNLLLDLGVEVHFAANFTVEPIDDVKPEGVILHQIDCTRAPLTKENCIAFKQLCKLMDQEKFDLIHCHTPVGGMLGRLLGHKYRKIGVKVIYSAHGFHFYKGAPKKLWGVIYPVEWGLPWMTDTLITINKEDYNRAHAHFHSHELYYVPGVGIDIKKFNPHSIDAEKKRAEFDIGPEDIMLVAVGELNPNKNHQVLIKALSKIDNPKVKLCIFGIGGLKEKLLALISRYNLQNRIKIIGYRRDINEIYQCADIFVFPSIREGLSAALMESMACACPVICTDIRGNNDLIDNGKGGYRISPFDVDQWIGAINKMVDQREKWKSFGNYNREKIQSSFNREIVLRKMKSIYGEYLDDGTWKEISAT